MKSLKMAGRALLLATAVFGLSNASASSAGLSAPISSGAALITGSVIAQDAMIEQVQVRRGRRVGNRGKNFRYGGNFRRGWTVRNRALRGRARAVHGPRYGRRYYLGRSRNYGAALAAGAVAATVGALIANSGRSSASYHDLCDEKYKTYDRSTGTFMGFDGNRHYCRL